MKTATIETIITDLESLLDHYFVSGARSFSTMGKKDVSRLAGSARHLKMDHLDGLLSKILEQSMDKPDLDRLVTTMAKLDTYLEIVRSSHDLENAKKKMEKVRGS